MSEIAEKVDQFFESTSPRTFEAWVNSHSEGDRQAIEDALEHAYHTRAYQLLFDTITKLNSNPWTGSKDAMREYAIRRFGA